MAPEEVNYDSSLGPGQAGQGRVKKVVGLVD
jgi:hypothetical protein